VELTEELLRIQKMVKRQLALFQGLLSITYLVLDGHFGNNNALQMVRQCGLHLVSKLRHDAALHFVYQGASAGQGPPRNYGDKINYDQLSITISGGNPDRQADRDPHLPGAPAAS
jgi:putative transposase